MNRLLAILFLAVILILTQNKFASFAVASSNTLSSTVTSDNKVHLENKDDQDEIESTHIDKEDDEDEDDQDSAGRVISIIPNSSNSANLRHTLTGNVSPTVSPTPTQTTDTTVNPTPTQETNVDVKASQNESASANFDLIKELEKLLSSLKKIIFNTLS